MGMYPVQRHAFRLSWNQSRTSSRVGFGFVSSSPFAETMKPGVQKPHWAAPCFIHAFWSGWSFSGVPIPSIVTIYVPSGRRDIL